MTGSGKILTVSYGTFSCTLEGFDDPFTTMRTIAEYFRDLAAEDRYFGAEPPTPNPDVIHQLAAREPHKQVEARVTDEGLSLRQIDPSAQKSTRNKRAILGQTSKSLEGEDVQNAFVDLEATEDGAAKRKIAEKLNRIREVVSRDLDHQPAPADTSEPTASTLAAFARGEAGDADDDAIEEIAPDAVAQTNETSENDDFELPSEADLKRAHLAMTLQEFSDYTENEEDQNDRTDTLDSTTDALEAHLAEQRRIRDATLADIDTGRGPGTEVRGDPPIGDAVDLTEDLRNIDQEGSVDDDGDNEAERGHEGPQEPKLSDEESLATIRQLLAEAGVDAPQGLAAAAPAVSVHGADDGTEEPADASLDADDEDAPEEDILHLIPEDEAVEFEDTSPAATDTDDEDEVGGRTSYDGPAATLRVVSEAPSVSPPDDERPLRLANATDSDVTRLMAEADQKFEDGEGQRRRRVISQLRAAVLAAKADRAMGKVPPNGDGLGEAEEESAYRRDLSRTISRKPTREESAPNVAPIETQAESAGSMPGAPVERAVSDRAAETTNDAPLMLASAQRISGEVFNSTMPEPDDSETEEKPDAVLPQRVNTDPDAPSQRDAASFAEFAHVMGAKDLSDLLEAAAAYTAFVEGMPSFSRPQIMKRVARVKPQVEVSREEGLRSFGQLLRQGKIQKLERGQFTISENTRFNPGHRIAGE